MSTPPISWKDPVSENGQTTISGTFTANGKNYEVSIVYNTQDEYPKTIPEGLTEKISKIGTKSLAKLVGYTFKSTPKKTESKEHFQIFQGENKIEKLNKDLESAKIEIHNVFEMFLSGQKGGIQEITT